MNPKYILLGVIVCFLAFIGSVMYLEHEQKVEWETNCTLTSLQAYGNKGMRLKIYDCGEK